MAIFNHYKTPVYMLCCAGALSTLVSCNGGDQPVYFQVLEKIPIDSVCYFDDYFILAGVDDPLNKAQLVLMSAEGATAMVDIDNLIPGKLYCGNWRHYQAQHYKSDGDIVVWGVQDDAWGKPIAVPELPKFCSNPNERLDMTQCIQKLAQIQNEVRKRIVFNYDIQITSKNSSNSARVNVMDKNGDVIYSNYPVHLSDELASSLKEGMRYKANFKISTTQGCYLDSVTPLERENTLQQEVTAEPQSILFQVLEKDENSDQVKVVLHQIDNNGAISYELADVKANGFMSCLNVDSLYKGEIDKNNALVSMNEQEAVKETQETQKYRFKVLSMDDNQAKVVLYGDTFKDFKIDVIMLNDENISLKVNKVYQGQFIETENKTLQLKQAEPQEKPVSHNRVSVPQTVYERSIVRA